MRVDDQTKVSNAIAAAIEYIAKLHESSLAGIVVRELRGANAIVGVAARREVETLPTLELSHLAAYALETLALRENAELPEDGPFPRREEQYIRFAQQLAQRTARYELRISTAADARARVRELEGLCADAHQLTGQMEGPLAQRIRENLWAGFNGDPIPHAIGTDEWPSALKGGNS